MSSNSFAIAKSATVKLKMKMLLAGFFVTLCSTAIQFCDRQSNRSFLFLQKCWFCRRSCGCCGRIGLKDCRVSAKRASCVFRHYFIASTNSGCCRRGMHRNDTEIHWRSTILAKKKSCFATASLLKDTTFQPQEQNVYRTPNIGFFVWMLMSLRHLLARIVGWPPCFDCLAFSSISFALKNMICLSDAPCFGSRLEFFLMTKPGIEAKVAISFLGCCRTPIVLHDSEVLQIYCKSSKISVRFISSK